MRIADVSLTADPTYLDIVRHYADDLPAFDNSFAHAWYKLTTRDMGPATRCVGADVPAPQPFQYPLPPPPSDLADLADFGAVKASILSKLLAEPALGPELVRLAFSCASTFRVTDYQGGCNGARVRFEPQTSWAINGGLDTALTALAPIKAAHADGLSWADLIVLGGTTALENAGAPSMSFCGGRTDADDGTGSEVRDAALGAQTTSHERHTSSPQPHTPFVHSPFSSPPRCAHARSCEFLRLVLSLVAVARVDRRATDRLRARTA